MNYKCITFYLFCAWYILIPPPKLATQAAALIPLLLFLPPANSITRCILPTVHDFAVVLGVISLLSVQLISFANDPGVGWHLKTGELILNAEFPFFDPFLASDVPRAWISDQWLSDVILFGLFNFAGYPLLYALLSIFFLALFFWYSWKELRSFSGFSIASTIAVLFAFKLSQIHFILRPVIFSFGFFAFLYFFLLKKDFVFSLKNKLVLFLVFLLWANIHPSFVLGFVLFGVYFIASLLNSPKRFKSFIIPGLIILLATLFNPYGYKLYASILELGSDSYFMQLHQEWQPVKFTDYSGFLFLVVSLLSVFGVIFFVDLRKKLGIFPIASFFIFCALCFSAIRFLPYFAIVSLPVLALSLGSFTQFLDRYLKDLLPIVTGAFRGAEEYDQKNASRNLMLILTSLTILVSVFFTKEIPFYKGEFGPPKAKFPYSEVKWIIDNANTDELRVLAPPKWGGFISWQSNLKLKPIIDDRNTLVGKDLYKSYFNIFKSEYGLSKMLKGKKIRYLITPLGGELSKQASKLVSFKSEFKGNVAEVYSAKY